MKEIAVIMIAMGLAIGLFMAFVSSFIFPKIKMMMISAKVKSIYRIKPVKRRDELQLFLQKHFGHNDFSSGYLPNEIEDLGEDLVAMILVMYLYQQGDIFYDGSANWILDKMEDSKNSLMDKIRQLDNQVAVKLRNSFYYRPKKT